MKSAAALPCLSKAASTWQLHVDGKPYLILGGQVQNSSLSSAEHMKPIWKRLVDMGINTVLGPVSWEDIEPTEGAFEFKELDAILDGARSHGLRLVLLWFGSFKNGMSTYAPSWVKKDAQRFPRAQVQAAHGSLKTVEVLSVFSQQCVDADAKAFATFMRHLKAVDQQRTVIMVQVENESGLLTDTRDRSHTAETTFRAPPDKQLLNFLERQWSTLDASFTSMFQQFWAYKDTSTSLDWEGYFGKSQWTDELFMAYHYARYLNQVAAAGKAEYSLPLFINVWLPKPESLSPVEGLAAGGHRPGIYPSGGATSSVLNIWEEFAPSIDFISPDIYSADYTDTCDIYGMRDQALFIPEQRRDAFGARRMSQAIGTYGAIGVCPFAIDTLTGNVPFAPLYKLLQPLSTIILAAQARPNASFGFYFDEYDSNKPGQEKIYKKCFGNYKLTITRAFVLGQPGPGTGLILETGPSKFVLVGMGFKVQFQSLSTSSHFTGILTYKEKRVSDAEKGVLETVRSLNGDETKSGAWCNMPNDNPDYGDQYIPMTCPAGTMISEVEVYSLERARAS
ncbi:glycoside hydrolase family 35 protein [Amniculicola lignicola CBS 123094]|uniref:Glycoside hydrolase family 35 protein n=1 Tax=Amniculicola lignicola CBS 123094 TaxID=1392246 RepID=A0A6A5WVM8_9PLEO|nr:glycoside hydrolase family 35 protein [Amniculicola lignicola CBS 123094]